MVPLPPMNERHQKASVPDPLDLVIVNSVRPTRVFVALQPVFRLQPRRRDRLHVLLVQHVASPPALNVFFQVLLQDKLTR
jgi:hypothetical protein